MDTRVRAAVIGAGAMGCLFGASLAEAGCAVTFVDIRPEVVDAITANGILLEQATGTRAVSGLAASTDFAPIAKAKLVVVFVKATATAAAARAASRFLHPRALVLSLQNGLGNIERLCSLLPPASVVAGTTGCGAAELRPGHVRVAGIAETVIGELHGEHSERIARTAELLSAAGLATRVSANITGVVWTKLLANAGINALAALTGLTNGQVASVAEAFAIARQAVLEAAAVAAASGVSLTTDDPVAHLRHVAEMTARNHASMLQDVRAKRMTEIDAINGEIARRGQALGIPVPVNSLLASLVRLRQSGYETL